ncbi:MAG: ribonucleoside triphosphate reductase [Candidatus Omnitrophica bacterium]|nr:ribonucleoside triphosphate reductase [Candidatus Omnitrophota bacterium]MBU1128041.1 ribonucleoside triphosphate reductase [Candidatus Omnitrophota bacterium]MBU1851812.1 ribonucleoside triphosphate reductase [Candidatus Omnitrophota bacterium]
MHPTDIKFIRKRDGRLEQFEPAKIDKAILEAAKAVGGEDAQKARDITRKLISFLEVMYKGDRVPTVENVQDLVEKILIENGHAKTAKAYILYREQHAKLRQTKKLLSDAVNMVDNYIQQKDWRVKENANMGYSLQGLNNFISTAVSNKYWLDKIYPKEIAERHLSGDVHIHDLGSISAYCCGWDLKDLLIRGFGGAYGKVESNAPKHFRVALGQIVNFFYTLQGEAAGAQAFSNFDTLLAPYIRYDGLEYSQIKQYMQEFIFNINVPTRVGFQTPFTNITMDLVIPEAFKDEAVIIGGKPRDAKYGDFQHEANLINKAFCEVMIAGDAKGRIFSFPIPTYNITKDFDWENKDLDGLWEMTAKYGIPYFSNFVNSDMDPNDARSMCCRLRLDNRELRKRGGGLFGSNPLTGSIGVVTLNLPRLAYMSVDKKEFFEGLDELMRIAKESLELKRRVLEDFTAQGLYPYSKHYLSDVKNRLKNFWANHFSTIGVIGVNEACLNLLKEDIGNKKGKEFAKELLDYIRRRMVDFQEETGHMYNLEATPAEGTTYRLAKMDREKYPGIITQGKDEPYYTNSSNLPVNYTDDLLWVMDHQDDIQSLYTGGTVFHMMLGERIEDKNVCKNLVRKIASNYKMPYYTVTPSFTICSEHGYISGEHFTCPYGDTEEVEQTRMKRHMSSKQCKVEVFSRVTGFFRPVQSWNKGKAEEFKDRKKFNRETLMSKDDNSRPAKTVSC